MFDKAQIQDTHPRALQKIEFQLLLLREAIKDAQLTTPLIDHQTNEEMTLTLWS